MNLLAHYIKKQLTGYIEKLNQLHSLYLKRSYDLDVALPVFLEECKKFYRQTGASNKELRMNELLSYFDTSKRGYNPGTLEKIKTGRRGNIFLSVFYCLNEAGESLKSDMEEVEIKLAQATETINNVLLSILQSGGITTEGLFKYDSIEKCEVLWQQLIKDSQINLIDKKLKTTILAQDIYLLLDQIIVKMKG